MFAWIFRALSYCTFYSTSPLQKQRTYPRQLSRQMSYDNSPFTATVYRSEAFSGYLSHMHQRLSNHRLPCFIVYVHGSLEYLLKKLFPWQLVSSYVLPDFLRARTARKPITLRELSLDICLESCNPAVHATPLRTIMRASSRVWRNSFWRFSKKFTNSPN